MRSTRTGNGARGDDVGPIETSRPDAKKAEEEWNRIIVIVHGTPYRVSTFLTPGCFSRRERRPQNPAREGGSRGTGRTTVHAHLRQGQLPPTCGAPEAHRDIATPQTTATFGAPDKRTYTHTHTRERAYLVQPIIILPLGPNRVRFQFVIR